MGLLEELRQQAESQRGSGQDPEAERERLALLFREHTDPGMSALREFLRNLAEQLKALGRTIETRYEIPGYGEIVGRVAPEFDIRWTAQGNSRELVLNAVCQIDTERCPPREIEGTAKLRTVAALFQKHQLSALSSVRKDPAGTPVAGVFRPRGKLPFTATFVASADTPTVRAVFRNVDSLGEVGRNLPPEQLGDGLFDQIGRFLLREQNTLMREELPEAYREQLRKKVEQDQRKRRWEEMVLAQQQREAERAAQEQRGLRETLLRHTEALGKRLADHPWIGGLVKRLRGKDDR